MKKVIITGSPASISSVSAYSESYLRNASCPVLVMDKSGQVTFEWDDSKTAPDGTPLEHLCPRPIHRIMDTVNDIVLLTPETQEDLRKRLEDMKPGSTLRYDYDVMSFVDPDEPVVDEEGNILLKSGLTSIDALHFIKDEAKGGRKLAARLGHKVITLANMDKTTLTAGEMLSSDWEVIEMFGLTKEIEERIRTNEIRGLLKCTNYLGIKHTAIDEMSIDDIWKKLCEHEFSVDRKYEMLKKILE